MAIGDSFDKTLKEFVINASWLSRASGVNAQMISRFRNGKEVQTDTLDKLMEPLPSEAKQYFYSLLLGSAFKVDLEALVKEMDSRQLGRVVYLAGVRLTEDEKLMGSSSDSHHECFVT